MYRLEVKVWGEWFTIKRSLNPGIYKIYTDGFCTGHIAATDIEDIRVIKSKQ